MRIMHGIELNGSELCVSFEAQKSLGFSVDDCISLKRIRVDHDRQVTFYEVPAWLLEVQE